MRKNWFRIIMKVLGASLLIVVLIFSIGISQFAKRKSDKKIIKIFQKDSSQIFIKHFKFKNKDVRVFAMQKEIDSTLPTLVFVHGSPGSSLDFKKYLLDDDLNKACNIIAYDRIGYGKENTGEVLNSIADENKVLHEVVKEINFKTIVLLGYSYGGTIALASTDDFKKKIILAGAVRGDLEPMFWFLNFYKWELTRPLVPKVFQAAAKEKIKHVTELATYENKWALSKAPILCIHGNKDRIVPYENSLFLKEKLDENKFSLITINKGNHALVWTNFDLIKKEILNALNN